MQFEQAQDTVDIETLLEDMANSPYAESFNEFWTTPACHAPRRNDIEVPIIYNTVTDVVRSERFPETVHDYFWEERKDQSTWLKMINTPTPQLGFTFLDFIEYNFQMRNYSSKPLTDAANRIIAYVCQHGGVYSKYKDAAKCP